MTEQPKSKPLPKAPTKNLITVEGTKISSKAKAIPSTVVKR